MALKLTIDNPYTALRAIELCLGRTDQERKERRALVRMVITEGGPTEIRDLLDLIRQRSDYLTQLGPRQLKLAMANTLRQGTCFHALQVLARMPVDTVGISYEKERTALLSKVLRAPIQKWLATSWWLEEWRRCRLSPDEVGMMIAVVLRSRNAEHAFLLYTLFKSNVKMAERVRNDDWSALDELVKRRKQAA